MGESEMIHNALGVSRVAEAELIGIALRYELDSGHRLNWMFDTAQCIGVLNLLVNCDNPGLKSRAARFYEALDANERKRLLSEGLIFPAQAQGEPLSIQKKQSIYRDQKVT